MKKLFFLGIVILSVFSSFAGQRKKNAGNSPLLHTKWILEEIYETLIEQGKDTTYVTFSDNYKISGNSGCNLFFGNFSYGKKRIKIDFLGSTKRLCANMSLEERFSKALRDGITYYHIEKNKLFLRNKNKVVLKFESN